MVVTGSALGRLEPRPRSWLRCHTPAGRPRRLRAEGLVVTPTGAAVESGCSQAGAAAGARTQCPTNTAAVPWRALVAVCMVALRCVKSAKLLNPRVAPAR